MNKRFSIFMGVSLIVVGLLALGGNLLFSLLGFDFRWWQFWRLWPLVVVALGILLALPPVFMRHQRWTGVFFIPAVPIWVTGSILMFASTFDAWGAWAYLWPLEVLGLALGFMFASLYARSSALAVPAVIIGMNGLVLQFCALTGLWGWWAVLWGIEPLAVGLALLLIGVQNNSKGVIAAGLAFCGFSGVAIFGMSALLLVGGWIFRIFIPAGLILIGVLVLALPFLSRSEKPEPPAPPANSETLVGEGAA
jgi:hypothetical protein